MRPYEYVMEGGVLWRVTPRAWERYCLCLLKGEHVSVADMTSGVQEVAVIDVREWSEHDAEHYIFEGREQ